MRYSLWCVSNASCFASLRDYDRTHAPRQLLAPHNPSLPLALTLTSALATTAPCLHRGQPSTETPMLLLVAIAISGAPWAASPASVWLRSSSPGACGITERDDTGGGCNAQDKGSWQVPSLLRAWRPAITWCLAKCAGCRRCAFVSISVQAKDCSWFASCGTRLQVRGFKSGRAIALGNSTAAERLLAAARASHTVYTEPRLRLMRKKVEQPSAKKMLRQFLRESAEGVCAKTREDDEGDCDDGEQGTWKLDDCEATSQHVALAQCLLRCSNCARCAYVSVSVRARECAWYHRCRLSRLESAPIELRFLSGALSAVNTSSGSLARLLLRDAIAPLPAQRALRLTDLLTPAQNPGLLFSAQLVSAGDAQPVLGPFDCSEVQAPPATERAAAQMCSAAALQKGRAWLVLGVFSGLGSTARRADIRATWWRWEALRERGEARACFVLAWRAENEAVRVAHEEARRHGDVVRLLYATEGCRGCSYSKLYEWWRWAGSLPASVTHVGKTEDDAIVHVPNLLADLSARRRTPFLFYGSFQWAGLRHDADGVRLKGCGHSWQGPDAAQQSCSLEHGGYPGSPFASGPLELVSADLVRRLATDAPIARFVALATRRWSAGQTDEDVLLGVWISHLQASTPGLSVAYANAGSRLGDLHCRSEKGMYQVTPPSLTLTQTLTHPSTR